MSARFALWAALLLAPAPALAGLEFCNQTGAKVSVAIGYKGDKGWTSEGWWNFDPTECREVISRDLTLSHYYWRAESAELSWDHENYMFCTSDDVFTIVGDEDCAARGYDREGFNEIETVGYTSFTMSLIHGSDNLAPSDPEENIEYPDEGFIDPNAAAPGTHGEPYSVTGLLSHCDWYDAGLGCTILAGDWAYVASSYDLTDADLLVSMDEQGVNMPVTISGDLMSYEGTEAVVTIREYSLAISDQYAGTRAQMQGFWTSRDDPAFQVLIHGSSYEEYYDQLPDLPLLMQFADQCPASPGDAPVFSLFSRDGTEDRCFYVVAADGQYLELFPAGAMRPLMFDRAD